MAKKFDISKIQSQVSSTAQNIEENTKKVKVKNFIPIDLIDFNPNNIFNKQDTDETIKELADDIKKNGLYHDILVCKKDDGRYLLISGERRLRASIYNKETTISATIEEGLSDDDILIQLFNANLQTRLISLDQRLEYIDTLKSKLSNTNKDNIKNMISKAFNVDDRQARKLMSVNDGLNDNLLSLLKNEIITINEASSYSTLPNECQDTIYDVIIWGKNNDKDLLGIKKQIQTYTKQVKGKMSFSKKSISKPVINIKNSTESIKSLEKELDLVSEPEKEKIKAKISKLNQKIENYQKEISSLQNKNNKQINKLSDEFKNCIKNEINNTEIDIIKESKKVIKSLNTNLTSLKKLYPDEEFLELEEIIKTLKSKYL